MSGGREGGGSTRRREEGGSGRRREGFEERLESLRDEAARAGIVRGEGVAARGGPLPGGRRRGRGRAAATAGGGGRGAAAERAAAGNAALPGYYGMPVVKPPVWTWEVPVYLFVGGLAGMAAVIALPAALYDPGAVLAGAAPTAGLARAAAWTAAAGSILCAALLISDLGRPRRFLNMLRVFKWRSPMSMGAWILSGFGAAAWPGALILTVSGPLLGGRAPPGWLEAGLVAALAGAAVLGVLLATYTGVLIGATAIPAWHAHRRLLPVHFGIAGLGSAAAFLQLVGFRPDALLALGILAAAGETVVGAAVELRRHGAADRALRRGRAALLLRGGGLLAGPAALALWIAGVVPLGAAAFLAGALASRFGWMAAGRGSGRDPEAAFAAQR